VEVTVRQRSRAYARSLRTQQRVLRPHPPKAPVFHTPRGCTHGPPTRGAELVSHPGHERRRGMNIPDTALDAHPEGCAPGAP
jgi:hypothetical protein